MSCFFIISGRKNFICTFGNIIFFYKRIPRKFHKKSQWSVKPELNIPQSGLLKIWLWNIWSIRVAKSMVTHVALVNSCVIPIYCKKFNYFLDNLFCFKWSKFISPFLRKWELNELGMSFFNYSSSFQIKERLQVAEMYIQATTEQWLFFFVAFLMFWHRYALVYTTLYSLGSCT